MDVWAILLVGLALSMDGFMVGIAYGIKKIGLPLVSLLVITLASVSVVSISMIFGKGLALVIPPVFALHIGAFLLIGLGLYHLMSGIRQKINNLEGDEEEPILTLSIKALGIIIQILKNPSRADFDASGEIGLRESVFLGLALSVDALGAGIGLALTGANILYTASSVGMIQFILVNSGIFLGKFINSERLKEALSLVPGIILIGIGLLKIM
ncbi:MAG TPA: sporulation membrane protein YtaF [Syntrophomonadaceae bacterium]|nr:sporulation membrane protein YtaF [Syntrophomonadaceae bacterium]